ncbi:chorismate mutase [Candidatus Pacearchaeota archaeon]|nr:chorismate mutase [Candidatus Pacearchaeota archaeon]
MENKTISSLEIERQKINQIDKALVKLIDKRFEIVRNILDLKQNLGLPIFQPLREQKVLEKIAQLSQNPKQSINIFQTIISESRKLQEQLTWKTKLA